jgi:1-acyl-sn-glycerol-3-phosphate acyltransferase
MIDADHVEKIEHLLRSLAYQAVFIPMTLIIGIVFLPLLIINHSFLRYRLPYLWAWIALKLQKYILGLDYRVKSHVKVPKHRAVFAVKHQSAWETIALLHILDRPVFVLKKELLRIPVFGWYLGKADNIVIDRKSGQKAIGQIIEQSMKYLSEERVIVIFPEGTRTKAGEQVRYKQGIANLYEALSPPIYPVGLNSGVFWARNSFIRRPGVVDVEIMPPMPYDLSKQEFMEALQTTIETVSTKLLHAADIY